MMERKKWMGNEVKGLHPWLRHLPSCCLRVVWGWFEKCLAHGRIQEDVLNRRPGSPFVSKLEVPPQHQNIPAFPYLCGSSLSIHHIPCKILPQARLSNGRSWPFSNHFPPGHSSVSWRCSWSLPWSNWGVTTNVLFRSTVLLTDTVWRWFSLILRMEGTKSYGQSRLILCCELGDWRLHWSWKCMNCSVIGCCVGFVLRGLWPACCFPLFLDFIFWNMFSYCFPRTFLKHEMMPKCPEKHETNIHTLYRYGIFWLYSPKKGLKTFKATGCQIQCYSGSIWKHWQLEPHVQIFGYVSQGQCSYPKSSVMSVTKVQIMLGSPLFAGKCCRILVVCHEFHLPTLEVSLKFIAKMVLSDLNQKIRSALAKVKRLAATCTWGGDQNCQQHPACQVSEDERKGFSEMIEGGGTGHGNYRPLVELLTSFHQSLTGMNVVSESLREPPRFNPSPPRLPPVKCWEWHWWWHGSKKFTHLGFKKIQLYHAGLSG